MTIYFLYQTCSENVASSVRMEAYFKVISTLPISVVAVYLSPNEIKYKRKKKYNNVREWYLWENFYVNIKGLNQICDIINLIRFRWHLKKGDIVYTYSLLPSLPLIMGKPGVRYYNEHTEFPLISGLGYHLFKISMDRCLRCFMKLDGLFVISSELKRFYVSNNIPSEKIHIINIIVDHSRFDGIIKQKMDYDYLAYCGANFNNKKDGTKDLLSSFSIVHQIFPNYKLMLIGASGEEDFYECIEKLGLKDSVIVTGAVPSEEVPKLLMNASVLLLNRPDNIQAKYGFPTKIGEYLMTANPVVATDVGSLRDFLIDCEDICLSTPSDIKDFAHKVNMLLSDRETAIKIGQSGYQKARYFFDNVHETEKLINVICQK